MRAPNHSTKDERSQPAARCPACGRQSYQLTQREDARGWWQVFLACNVCGHSGETRDNPSPPATRSADASLSGQHGGR